MQPAYLFTQAMQSSEVEDVGLKPDVLKSAQPRSVWLCRALTSDASAIICAFLLHPETRWHGLWPCIVALLVLHFTLIDEMALAQHASVPLSKERVVFQQPVQFDIPAQPLELALNAYGAATQIQLFVDAELVSGLRSTALQGVLTPEAALRALLAGTGLTARAIDDQGITLVPLPPGNGSAASAPGKVSATVMRFNNYSAAIQDTLRIALCRRAETTPGSYRALMRIWINASGVIVRSELVTSTGNGSRDAAIAAAVRDLAVGLPPPRDLRQPVTLLVSADGASSAYCSDADSSLRRAEIGREAPR
ncbi:secretin and TonB N-terminal domain-containing protein [Bradyrhizobium valentinum]|uniref:Secretin/TonB short N-terminal domain-containing protein n=1 Tax=Bradyrhizobium valentinum TaxID=1518501 RepID=A0A0R3KXX9_9BRAD|nr:secretin and TonB N-terminal domain-containing protein [Bradyrhizobium valentinum]KRQ92813.1 hypothetical protein CP49_39765 [Bradyrhizobium valentinum]KRR00460.1 hypothetical protein CQ10_22490 [Bradyrhizobium valentinum]